jgi:hypothetical protein
MRSTMRDEATNIDTKERPAALSKLYNTSSSESPSIEEGNVPTGGHVLPESRRVSPRDSQLQTRILAEFRIL